MKRASRGARSPTSIMRRARLSARSTAASTMACRCRWPNCSVWLYAHRRACRRQARSTRSPPSTSARSATTMSMTARRNATARWRAFPGFEIDEIAARRFAKLTGESEPAAGPLRRGRHAGLLPELRPAGRVRRGDGDRRARWQRATVITTSARSSTSTSPSRCGCR